MPIPNGWSKDGLVACRAAATQFVQKRYPTLQSDAEDIGGEVLLLLMGRNRASVGNPVALARTMAKNQASDRLKQQRRVSNTPPMGDGELDEKTVEDRVAEGRLDDEHARNQQLEKKLRSLRPRASRRAQPSRYTELEIFAESWVISGGDPQTGWALKMLADHPNSSTLEGVTELARGHYRSAKASEFAPYLTSAEHLARRMMRFILAHGIEKMSADACLNVARLRDIYIPDRDQNPIGQTSIADLVSALGDVLRREKIGAVKHALRRKGAPRGPGPVRVIRVNGEAAKARLLAATDKVARETRAKSVVRATLKAWGFSTQKADNCLKTIE